MLTQTHVFTALAIWAKPKQTARNVAIIAGALVTDAFIYIGLIWYVGLKGHSVKSYFDDLYFQDNMQFWSALSNSLPLYGALAFTAWLARKRAGATLVCICALAAFSQSLIDLPVHAQDAHRHVWPLSDFRFISPISYWDPAYYGHIFGPLDMILGLACICVLWRRFTAKWSRIVLGLFAALYIIGIGASLISAL